MRSGIEIGFVLDRQWHLLWRDVERTKAPTLVLVGRILADASVPYAIVGGVALQFHQTEPRTTLDSAVAVSSRAQIPRARLEAAGFRRTGEFVHSENWVGPGETPVHLTAEQRARLDRLPD